MVGKFNSKNHMTHYKHVQVNEQSRRKNEIKLLVNLGLPHSLINEILSSV